MRRTVSRRLAVAVLTTLSCLAAPAASHALTVLGNVPCTAQAGGAQFCQGNGGTTASDGQNILDANVTLPAGGAPAGGFPLIIVGHGYGGSKKDYTTREAKWIPSAKEWAAKGYAVLNVTDRGFGNSCGKKTSQAAPADFLPTGRCFNGYIRLLDARYEVHDVQYLAGKLVDQGLVAPTKIGAVGESYGGGLSLMLATLKDRIMNVNGTLSSWKSPNGTPMSLAGAAPTIPWSSLVYSLVPNGRTLDYAITQPGDLGEPAAKRAPAGVEKQSFVSGLFASGAISGNYAAPGQDPQADLTKWFSRINSGEPYDGDATIDDIFNNFVKYRDPYELLNGESNAGPDTVAPAPLLISNGFTDDLFPVDENVRYYNLLRAKFPSSPIALVDMDYGHMRGQNKQSDTDYLYDRTVAWVDRYVKGDASVDTGPAAVARTQTCPAGAASQQYTASTWEGLHPGQVTFSSATAQTILSTGGNANNARTFDPVGGGGDPCATVADDNEPGSALYTLPAATGAGYTLLGSPTITAQLAVSGTFPEVIGRLVDVGPDGSRTLVARGIYRPDPSGRQTFQLHPGAWRFAAGHRPELELLGQDVPYARKSNGQFSIAVSNLSLVLPTHESSGNGIRAAQALPLPAGARPAPGAIKAKPRFSHLKLSARQPRKSVSTTIKLSGRLVGTAGRRCSGRVRVTIRFGKRVMRKLRPVVRKSCTFRSAPAFNMNRLGRKYRSRSQTIRLRVSLTYVGNSALRATKTTTRTVRVRRR